jgi:hypothetical protein
MDQQDTEQVFKGMRRFRYVRPDVLLDDAKQSPYFWWWAYLRLSKDYCDLPTQDRQMIKTAPIYATLAMCSQTFEVGRKREPICLLNVSHHQKYVSLIA